MTGNDEPVAARLAVPEKFAELFRTFSKLDIVVFLMAHDLNETGELHTLSRTSFAAAVSSCCHKLGAGNSAHRFLLPKLVPVLRDDGTTYEADEVMYHNPMTDVTVDPTLGKYTRVMHLDSGARVCMFKVRAGW